MAETAAQWAQARASYEKTVAALEANRDRREISCQSYQRVRINANREVGLEHGPHCKRGSGICGGLPWGKCIHEVSVEAPCAKGGR